jgi:L-serine deaminase
MRAALIFIRDILDRDPTLVPRIARLKIALFGALAATGEGHLTPQALLAGFEGEDPEKADPDEVPQRYAAILRDKKLQLGRKVAELDGGVEVAFDYYKDLAWHWDRQLPVHPNGMRFSVFSVEGDLLATNEYFSVGGGFVVNGSLATDPGAKPAKDPEEGSTALTSGEGSTSHPADVMENVFYKEVRRSNANQERRSGMAHVEDGAEPVRSPLPPPPGASGEERVALENTRLAPQEPEAAAAAPDADHIPLPFHNGSSLLRLCSKHNLTIAQIVFRNELTWRSPDEVRARIFHIWGVMEAAIRSGCHSTEELLPGPMKVQRRAPGLYRRLMRGLSSSGPSLGDRATSGTGGTADAAKGGTSLSGPVGMGSSSETPGLPAIGLSPTSGLAQSKRVHGSLTHHPLPTPPRRSISNPDIDRLSAFAIAVNEENAAGRRVVTAPTLGSCGTIPAVLYWHLCFHSDDQEKDVETFLLTCAAIAMLFKRGASISAAEAGW